jgi:hypothetical protein
LPTWSRSWVPFPELQKKKKKKKKAGWGVEHVAKFQLAGEISFK